MRAGMKKLSVLALAALGVLGTASAASANVMVSSAGNTQPDRGTTPGVDGTVNFAVYDRTLGGGGGDTFGTGLGTFDSLFVAGSGSPAFDTSARYLYLYQTINNLTEPSSITTNSVGVDGTNVTSYGKFTQTDFLAGTDVLGTAAGGGNPSGISLNGAPVIVGGSATVFNVVNVILNLTSVEARFNTPVTELAAGHESYLWGYTSNLPPQRTTTGIIDHGTTADGVVLGAAVPTPAAVWAGMALLGGLAVRRIRRMQKA